MSKHPEMLKTAADMMKAMPKEQLQAAMQQAGMPAVNTDMLAAAAEAMGRMKPDEIQQITAQMEAMRGSSSSSSSTGLAASQPAAAADVASSGSNMVQPSLAAPAAAGAGAGPAPFGGAGGMPDMSAMMTPEMISMASQMFANMKPEDMQAMSRMMGAAGGTGAAPGATPPAGMAGEQQHSHRPATVSSACGGGGWGRAC